MNQRHWARTRLTFHRAFEYLAPEIHWFCSRNTSDTLIEDALINSAEVDIWRDDVEAIAADFPRRQKAFTDCLEFYAYDGDDVIRVLDFLKKEVERNLERCDQCIVGYYKLKTQWLEHIEA